MRPSVLALLVLPTVAGSVPCLAQELPSDATKKQVERKSVTPFEGITLGQLTDVSGDTVLDVKERVRGLLKDYHVTTSELTMRSGHRFVFEQVSDGLHHAYRAELALPDGRHLRLEVGKAEKTPNLDDLALVTYPGSRLCLGPHQLDVTLGAPLRPQLERREARDFRDLLPAEYTELAELLEDAQRPLLENGFGGPLVGFSEIFVALPLGRDRRDSGKPGYEYHVLSRNYRKAKPDEIKDALPESARPQAGSPAAVEPLPEPQPPSPPSSPPPAGLD